jgi:UDP-N-acetylglucosamine diphosphorylase/glucosamine-1-phosphate N-acetyltransferase
MYFCDNSHLKNKDIMATSQKQYILFDDQSWQQLLPLTFTRPVAEIRIGILTIREKWERHINSTFSYLTQDYLQQKFNLNTGENNLLINGSVLPNPAIISEIERLNDGEALISGNDLIAIQLKKSQINEFHQLNINSFKTINFQDEYFKLQHPWDIFEQNGRAIKEDFELLTKGRTSEEFIYNNNILHPENIFVEKGAKLDFVTINATSGPVYIGKDTEVMEGSIIRGPFALCDHSSVKLGAKIYGPTTIGPHSKVGGEVNNTVIFAYSNKAHDGFLGNSVIGEWCNIGADSNTSNLKNNYATVKLWNYNSEHFEDTSLQFCGLIMGDHSKCGINTMFNTGTVIGVSANIFGSGFPRNFIPSFSWGGASGFTTYRLSKAFEVAEKVMNRRNIELSEADKKILETVFQKTDIYRKN